MTSPVLVRSLHSFELSRSIHDKSSLPSRNKTIRTKVPDALNATSSLQHGSIISKRSSSLEIRGRNVSSTTTDLESRFNKILELKEKPKFRTSPVKKVHYERLDPKEALRSRVAENIDLYSVKDKDPPMPNYIPPKIVLPPPPSFDPPRSLLQNMVSDSTHNNSTRQTNSPEFLPVNDIFNSQVTFGTLNLPPNISLPPTPNTPSLRATTPRKRPRLPRLYIPKKPNFDDFLPDNTNANMVPQLTNMNQTELLQSHKLQTQNTSVSKSVPTSYDFNDGPIYSIPQAFDTIIKPQNGVSGYTTINVPAVTDSIVLDFCDDKGFVKETKLKVWFKRAFGSVSPAVAIGLTLLLINMLVLDVLVLYTYLN
ncbi:hypothetical protein HK096_010667 [Nowakowskiella sp. JEL0078]|nr:hypothetical protein HK096_010667 [Nowakowskiella sp. JEL0078]